MNIFLSKIVLKKFVQQRKKNEKKISFWVEIFHVTNKKHNKK